MTLADVQIVLHAAASAFCIWHAVGKRNTADRGPAYLLAFVWTIYFILDQAHTALVGSIPSPDVEPIASTKTRFLFNLEGSLYFVWPAGFLAWIRWTFRRARPWPVVLAWLAASALSVAVPAFRGAAWFRFAGALHLAALAVEIASIVVWVRKREAPRPWHVAGMVAACMTALPAIPFLSPNEAREGYLLWVLRGLILGHLSIVAIVGGELWSRKT